jgi:hypothetical protein
MGCRFEEENIFDDSSANRVEKAKKEYTELLCSAPNGWVMEYFPTDDQTGYTFLMKFMETGEVKILCKNTLTNDKLTRDSCLFEFTAISGPVLTFNSYSENSTFHILSDPADIAATNDVNEQGIGYGGDYEFAVIKTEENSMLLKGLKRKVYIPLTKLPEDQNWEDYFNLLDEMNVTLFNVNAQQLQLTVNDSLFTLSGGSSHIFKIVPDGGDAVIDRVDMPFIVTDYGIRFVKAFEANGLSVQTFRLSDDKNSLICTDENVNAKIEGPLLADFFLDVLNLGKNMAIMSGTDDMSASMRATYNTVQASVESKGRTLNMLSFTYDKTWKQSLRLRTSKGAGNADGFFGFTMEKKSANEINLSFKGFEGEFDSNAKRYYDEYNGVPSLINILNGNFTISPVGNSLIPTMVKFTSISDPSIWFNLIVR